MRPLSLGEAIRAYWWASRPPGGPRILVSVAHDVGKAVASIWRSGAIARAAAADLRQMDQGDQARPRTSWIDDMVLVLASGWLITGMVLDAWAHTHQRLETFFTPWHGVLYSGFVVLMAWMAWIALRARLPYRAGQAVPVGYGLGLVGVGIFLVSAVGDGIWHMLFGVEVGIEAQFSPTHIGLFLGALLIFTTPLRAAWSSSEPGPVPTMRAFLPALLSLTWTTLLVQFLFLYVSAFREDALSLASGRPGAALATIPAYLEITRIRGLVSVQVTNLLLLGPLLLVLRRWRPPFGTATLLFGMVAALVAIVDEFARGEVVVAALAGGLAADWLIVRSVRWPNRTRALRTVAIGTPLALWASYFLAVQVRWGIAWPAELWAGSVLFAALGGLALSLLMVPPSAPPQPLANGVITTESPRGQRS
jgi:hypothetical protein